jgi:ATP-dependent Clp protease ATP-binding subunit ClpC
MVMFERYTEKARRTIFFARYEASQFGSPYIETEHLLLGLIREDRALTYALLTPEDAANIRSAIESHSKSEKKVSTNIDLPLSPECRQVLNNAAKQADQLSDQHIGTEHLLLGLLSQTSSGAAELLTRGVTAERVLQNLKKSPSAERPKTGRRKTSPPSSPPPWSWPDAT